MPKIKSKIPPKIDKNDQLDLTNLAISQYSLVFSYGGS